MPVKFVDLFSGAGGLGFGFKMAGFSPLAFVEVNRWAYETYRLNVGGRGFLADIRSLKPSDILDAVGWADAVIGGPPCRPFSKANMRRNGKEHPEFSLPLMFVNYIKVMKPVAAVMEEVPGFARYLRDAVIKQLSRCGYDVTELKLNAADYGVPQERRRFFIIALRSGEGICEVEHEILRRAESRRITVWEAISDLPRKALVGEDKAISYAAPPSTSYQKWARTYSRASEKLYNHVTSKAKKMLIKMMYVNQGENLIKAFSRMPENIRAEFKNPNAVHSNIYRRLDPNKPSITITNPRKTVIIHPYEHRIITVREAARLQGFPDAFIFKGPLSQMQQMVADAVPPLLAKAIAEALLKVL